MRPKHVSLTGLADFMTASPVRQRSIVRSYKYPAADEARARILYYREARDRVVVHHTDGHDPAWLCDQAATLEQLAASSPRGAARARLRHNARGLKGYAAHFARKRFAVQRELRLELVHGDLRVTVVPDLHVVEEGAPKILKLGFGVDEPAPEAAQIIAQTMFEAAAAAGFTLDQGQVLFLDVPRGAVHRGARARARMRSNIEAACQNFSAIWDTL